MALGLTASNRNEYQEYFLGGEGGRLQPYHLHVPIVLKSGRLNLPEHSCPVQACNGIDLRLSINNNTIKASVQVTNNMNRLKICTKWWSMKAIQSKATFTMWPKPYTLIFADNATVSLTTDNKYLRLCPDRRLKWRKDVMLKRQELNLRMR